MLKSIHHRDQTRTITVRSYTEGRLADDIVKELQAELAVNPPPSGYTIDFGGENEERNDAFAAIGKLSIIVILLIYIIMVMQFYSLSIPPLILSTVYLAYRRSGNRSVSYQLTDRLHGLDGASESGGHRRSKRHHSDRVHRAGKRERTAAV